MSDQIIVLPPDSTGKSLDTSQLTVGANTVQRERMNVADPTTAAALAAVTNAAPNGSAYGLVVWNQPSGTQTVLPKVAQSPASPTAATVGVASAQAVASNANRTGLVLTNTSNNTISLGLGATAVLNSGITLNSNGGVWVMDSFTFTTGAINAIASSASSNLAIQELS